MLYTARPVMKKAELTYGAIAMFAIFGGLYILDGTGLVVLQLPIPIVSTTGKSTKISPGNMAFDIMGKPQFKFDRKFKNPCWFEPIQGRTQLMCLPYFYLLGVKKSATSDLFERIAGHPEFAHPGFKESQWLAVRRFQHLVDSQDGFDIRTPLYYASMFSKAAEKIKTYSVSYNGTQNFPLITGDGTPSNLHRNLNWTILPGNEGKLEPRFTHIDYLHHLTPDAKIITIMRDPVQRLESDFYFHNPAREIQNPNIFHKTAKTAVKNYGECFQRMTMGRCIHNMTLASLTSKFDFQAGFYAFFVKEIWKVFPKENFLPILMNEYVAYPEKILRKIFDFLKMRQPSADKMRSIIEKVVKNKGRKHRPMLQKTRRMLQQFFAPFNQEMAVLMNDTRYLFLDS